MLTKTSTHSPKRTPATPPAVTVPPPRPASRPATVAKARTLDTFDARPTRDLVRLDAGRPTAQPGVSPELRRALTGPQQEVLDQVTRGALGPQVQADLDRLTGPSFGRLDLDTRTRVLRSFLQQPQGAIHNGLLTDLTQSPGFQALSPSQRQQALDVFEACDVAGQGRLVELANREVGGRPALLDRDAEGVTLVQRLHNLATDALDPRLAQIGLQREELLSSLLQECAHPGEVNQSIKGTCTVTSMQYMLCDTDPAEYARLMEGLLTGDGRVRMRGGQTLVVEADALADDDAYNRSATERIFQSAMMEYANGGESYSNADDLSRGKRFWFFSYEHSGLYGDQQERALEALFGRNFRRTDDDLIALFEDRAPAGTYVRMDWSEKKSAGHVVVVTKVEDGRVHFRNPWGPTLDPVGTVYQDPPRRLEDPDNRVESMTVEAFLRWSEGAIV